MAADDPARSALARVPWRRIPGFRRGSAWRATVAVLGYAGIALLALALRNPVSIVLYLASALAFVAVVTNAEAIRSRLPGTRLEGRPGVNATILWSVGLLGVGFVAWAAGVPPSGTAQPRPSASQPQAVAAIPTVAPSATAPLAPTATTPPEPTPTAPATALLTFTIAKSEQTNLPTRVRWSVDAVVQGDGSNETVAATCAEIARRTMRERANVLALVVFGYYEQAEVGRGYTRCRATVSRDGKGWTGDGKTINGDDRGDIIVEIPSVSTIQAQRIATGTLATIRLPR